MARGASRAGIFSYGTGVITHPLEKAPVTQQSAPGVNQSENETQQLGKYGVWSRLATYGNTSVTWAYVVSIG